MTPGQLIVILPWWLSGGAMFIYFLAFYFLVRFWVRFQSRQLRNEKELIEQKLNERTIALTTSIDNLRQAQGQLIQAEKMASLGELTAGIAHEIQNPLNFVNNFSEVNSELIEDLRKALEKENMMEAKELLKDIELNMGKITFHGKRADTIVKGMLLHSRASSHQKIPTDVNVLADEYLRLSYHGLRAKDKTFNARFNLELDERIKEVLLVQQDIGRVLLNLFNNAFYAVTEKKKISGGDYEPTVSVTTKRKKDSIEIRIRDNGQGIPGKVLEKIYQPFFTTKPAGQGTGLGLSLSYDIIAKEHGGKIDVATIEGEFSEFIIELPAETADTDRKV
jgi:signal transduction histidine kinase